MTDLINDKEYFSTVADIKTRIRAAQYRAALSANSELIILYWNIGSVINEHNSWGSNNGTLCEDDKKGHRQTQRYGTHTQSG